MLTHRVPYPPDRGDRIRSWNILRHLAESCNVSLGCVTEEPIGADVNKKLQSVCARVAIVRIGSQTKWLRAAASAARGRSLTEGLFWSPSLSRTLDQWAAAKRFDAVFVYCSSMLPYTQHRPLCDVPRFVDLVDVDSQKFFDYSLRGPALKRAVYRMEGRRVRRLEHEAVQAAEAVTLVSTAEAALLHGTMGQSDAKQVDSIHAVANGVDTEYFSPTAGFDGGMGRGENENTHPRLTFVGVMNYPPNVDAVCWFVENVWPALRRRFPKIEFDVVGKDPSPAVLRLGRVGGVRVVGAVTDVRPYLSAAEIVVAPLQIARGVQNKVLEAMAMGRPVVASPAAATGLASIDGKHLLIAETAQQWVSSVSRLCEHPSARAQLSTAARELVCEKYTWQATLAGLDRLLQRRLNGSDAN